MKDIITFVIYCIKCINYLFIIYLKKIYTIHPSKGKKTERKEDRDKIERMKDHD